MGLWVMYHAERLSELRRGGMRQEDADIVVRGPMQDCRRNCDEVRSPHEKKCGKELAYPL